MLCEHSKGRNTTIAFPVHDCWHSQAYITEPGFLEFIDRLEEVWKEMMGSRGTSSVKWWSKACMNYGGQGAFSFSCAFDGVPLT
eukprot:scaffold120028_cov18-Tisochrysis_lutea.AAC.2